MNEYFEENMERTSIVGLNSNLYENMELVIESALEVHMDTEFEDCNILFDLNRGASLNCNQYGVHFTDCHIHFKGSGNEVIRSESGYLNFDNCSFSQSDSKSSSRFIAGFSKSDIILSDCSVKNLMGDFIIADGSHILMEKVNANGIFGGIAAIYNQGGFQDENCDHGFPPKLKISDCNFSGCANAKSENNNGLIHIFGVSSATISNTVFEDYFGMVVYTYPSYGNWPNPVKIEECIFRNRKDLLHEKNKEETEVDIELRGVDFNVNNCSFDHVRGISLFSVMDSPGIMKNCTFDSCIAKNAFSSGIVIVYPIEERNVSIENCTFINCKVIPRFDDGDRTGVICFYEYDPPSKEERKFLIKDCKFSNCEAKMNIYGKIKQEGFFGRMICLYREN